MSEPTCPWPIVVAVVSALLGTSACAVGVKYQRPETPAPPAFHESLPAGWTDAQPTDSVPRGRWWGVYKDAGLDALERQVTISNENVLAAEAQFRAAQAAVSVIRAGQFPSVTTTPAAAISGTGATSGQARQYSIPVGVTYEADVWGSIRHNVAAGVAVAQASAAQLENARLAFFQVVLESSQL